MPLSLSDIKQSTLGPPRMVVYGVPGIGKTTFAARAPKPIFIPVEDGFGQLEVAAFPRPETYEQVVECINLLLNEQHDYETVVLDSLDKAEPLLWDRVCRTVKRDNGATANRIEEFGYAKGYTHALTEWRTLLAGFDALRAKGMTVILIAHSAVVRFEPPDSDPYERYQLKLDKKADAAICDWADAVLFANYKIDLVAAGPKGERRRGIGDGTRLLYTTERPAWRAKNRYRMPDELPLEWAAVQSAITPAVPA